MSVHVKGTDIKLYAILTFFSVIPYAQCPPLCLPAKIPLLKGR